jgi:hypothetical protein
MIRKGQVQGVAKGEVRGQVALVAKLFGVVAYTEPRGNSILILVSSSFLQHNQRGKDLWQKCDQRRKTQMKVD